MDAPCEEPTQLSPKAGRKQKVERKKFTYEEDCMLEKLVTYYGTNHWPVLCKMLPGRTARQCRERYKMYLAPNVMKLPWSKEDDDLLCKLVTFYGQKWAELAKFFPGRSDNNVKNRWYTYLKSRAFVATEAPKASLPPQDIIPSSPKTESSPEPAQFADFDLQFQADSVNMEYNLDFEGEEIFE